MGKIVGGIFKGAAAKIYIGIGFVPDWVRLMNMVDTSYSVVEWNRNMRRKATFMEGIITKTMTDVDRAVLAKTYGIDVFDGLATPLAADNAAYLVKNTLNHQKDAGQTSGITTWTLDSSANRTGHFDQDLDVNFNVDAESGAEVIIQAASGIIYRSAIVALSNDGNAASDVTLADAVPSGTVLFVGSPYDYIGAKAGDVVPAGFSVSTLTATVNDDASTGASAEPHWFEAGTYDDSPMSFGSQAA
jgi:hypothetical protein